MVSHDGVVLDGYVHLPAVPDGTMVPVVLHSTPYPGTCPTNNPGKCSPTGDDPATTTRIDTSRLVRNGFAVAQMSVRGTGLSEGCFGMGSPAEQLDQVALVEALAEAPWSSGQIGMIGHSYPSLTAWSAAVQAPSALKTIVVSGHMTDLYTFYHSPQGAEHWKSAYFQAGYVTSLGLPPIGGETPSLLRDPSNVRLCPDQNPATVLAAEAESDVRDAAFFAPRRLSDRLANVTAAVFIVSGFEDSGGSFHSTQDDTIWNALSSPKRGIWGHWGHDLPPPAGQIAGSPFGTDWYDEILVPWLDYWLKGQGSAADLGTARYQGTDGTWHTSSSWPPAEARQEALYLGPATLETSPTGHAVSVQPLAWLTADACTGFLSTPPAASDILIAGNPFAYLEVTSDQAGGTMGLELIDLPEGISCASAQPTDTAYPWTTITTAGADLRFLEGNMVAKPFPVGQATPVRLDFFNQGWTLAKGHSLGLRVSAAAAAWSGNSYAPALELSGHLILPVADGTFGGSATGLVYPPRPFEPLVQT